MSTEDQTNALKGLLGIKTEAAPTSSKKKTRKKDTNPTKQTNNGKPKSNRKSHDGSKNIKTSSGNVHNTSNGNGNANSAKKQVRKQKIDTRAETIEKKDSENYAWSAFQSPPDASNLPLPAFGNGSFDEVFATDTTTRTVNDETNDVSKVSEPIGAGPSSADDIKKMLNISSTVTNDVGRNEIAQTLETHTEEIHESVSGVNLAALALDDKHLETPTSEVPATPPKPKAEEPVDPLAMLMNPSYGTSASANFNMNNQVNSPYQNPPANNGPGPYGMQSPPQYASPHHHMMPQPYMTIQVQVPAQLLPGRQMVVPAAPGYNIPVIVPEGVQAGMVIPVTIPNIYARNAMPMGYGMPPGQQMPGMQMQQMQQQKPMQQNHNSPMAKKENKPAPGSWAAKAAAGAAKK